MKIVSLEISNIRGIRYFQHDFNAENAVILGANGTGKSSILDAIDFLITGNMSRLVGEGSGEISFKRHGAHIDMVEQLEKCYVNALIKLNGCTEPVKIERSLSDPEALISSCEDQSGIQKAIQHAVQGQHYLVRKRLLNFVHVSPSNRAKQIQTLLDLGSVEKARQSLKNTRNTLKKEMNAHLAKLESAQSDVKSLLDLDLLVQSEVLEKANAFRTKLGVSPVTSLSEQNVKSGILDEEFSNGTQPSAKLSLAQIDGVIEALDQRSLEEVSDLEESLSRRVNEINSNPDLLRSLDQARLIKLGIDLVDGDSCPLCDKPWDQEELKSHLLAKSKRALQATELIASVQDLERKYREKVADVVSRLDRLESGKDYFRDEQWKILGLWKARLESLRGDLQDSLANYPGNGYTQDAARKLFVNEQILTTLREVRGHVSMLAKLDSDNGNPQIVAFEQLTYLSRDWAKLVKEESAYHQAKTVFDQSAVIESTFVLVRDSLLASVYADVSCEFAALYRRLHNEDESEFSSHIYPKGAGLHMDVAFYDRGQYPPNALHSEGHQDSMGLCLFLVLSARLSGKDLQFTLLDDVVSSVDEGHRKQLAELLTEDPIDRQIIVTTHDPYWAKMLQSQGFANPMNVFQIDRWDLEHGIQHSDIEPVTDLVERLLNEGNVISAAAELRRWAESLLKQVCHNLSAPVPFRIGGQVMLNDVLGPGRKRHKQLLTKAIGKAQELSANGLCKRLVSLQERQTAAFTAIDKESWLLNWTIHDNPGAMPTPGEIRRGLRAYRDLCAVFSCGNCKRLPNYSQREKTVSCKCGNILWKV